MKKPVIGIAADHVPYNQSDDRVAEGVMEDYISAILLAGGVPVLLPVALGQEHSGAVIDRLDGVLLTGGHDINPILYGQQPLPVSETPDPAKDQLDLSLVQLCLKRKKPLLGICRGMQMLNIVLGGTLYQDLPSIAQSALHNVNNYPEHSLNAFAHTVQIVPDSQLSTALATTSVQTNSRHHQGVHELGHGLVPVATTEDGLIEGVEYPHHPFCVGVQWHPENLKEDPAMRRLFRHFVHAATLYGK